MHIELIIAFRFLREGKIQTLLVLGGITVGVGVIVFLSSLITGLQANIIQKTLGTQAHVVMRPPDDEARVVITNGPERTAPLIERRAQRLRSILQWQQVMRTIEQTPGVLAVSPMVSGASFAIRGNASKSVALMGIEPDKLVHIVPMPSFIKEGAFRVSGTDAAIGIDLARELGASLGDKVRLTTSEGRSEVVTITGIFDVGVRDLNRRWVFIPLRLSQNLLDLIGGVSSIDVTVTDIFEAETIGHGLEPLTGLTAESWMKTNSQLLLGLRSQNSSSYMIQFFVIVAVAFGIASVLVVSVVQKSREIGILRAMGSTSQRILRIFLIQGGVLGLVGSAFGCAIGAGLVKFFMLLAVNPDGSPYVPIVMEADVFILSASIAICTGLIAATVPAFRAAKLDPVEAIRYG